MYQKTHSLYQKYLDECDERYIALFNNISLVYFDKKQYFRALDYGYRYWHLLKTKMTVSLKQLLLMLIYLSFILF